MKYPIFIALLISSFCISSCSTPSTVGGFYQKHKRKKGVRNFKLPGWVVWVGSGIAHDIAKDDDMKIALRLVKKVKKLRFMMAEEDTAISNDEVQSFVKEIKQNNYEDLIYVKTKDTNVNMLVKDKDDKLKDIVFIVKDEENFVFFSMKSNIKVEDIAKLVDLLNDKILEDEDEKAEKKKKIPQA